MSYNGTYIFNTEVKKARNSFLVAQEYRKNTLSKTESGSHVKVECIDGISRIYNYIKNVEAYITSILHYQNEKIQKVYSL